MLSIKKTQTRAGVRKTKANESVWLLSDMAVPVLWKILIHCVVVFVYDDTVKKSTMRNKAHIIFIYSLGTYMYINKHSFIFMC